MWRIVLDLLRTGWLKQLYEPEEQFQLAFDGSDVWVTNTLDNTVVRVGRGRAVIKKTYAVEASPYGIIFDGTSVWVANYNSDTVDKISVNF